MKNTKRVMAKVNLIVTAWETGAPLALFAGMTLAQFKAAIKPALDSDSKMLALKTEQINERKTWENNAIEALNLAYHVVDGVKANTTFGPNSPLYSSMGYIAKAARKSGLTRKNAEEAAAAQAAESLKS